MMQRGINKESPDNPGYESGTGRSTTTSDGRAAVLTGATRLVSGQPANSVGNYRYLRVRLPGEKLRVVRGVFYNALLSPSVRRDNSMGDPQTMNVRSIPCVTALSLPTSFWNC